MGVCGSSLFGSGSQYIKLGNAEFIAVEGSSVFDRLGLTDIRAPYKQLLKGRVILKPGQTNYLLNHLGLGDNATFLAIKATYDSKSVNPDNNYITYSYYNNPVQNLTFAQLLVLTGNGPNRIPQLYLTNSNTNYNVVLDIMVGVIDDNYSFFNDDLNQSGTSFSGLEWTDIKSFVPGESIVIYDKNVPKRALIYFGLTYINSIALEGSFLIIDDDSYGTVFLNFLTEYDAVQAHSLLNYVLEHPNIDIDDPLLQEILGVTDDSSPTIYWNETAGATGSYIVDYTGFTSSAPYNTYDNGFTFSTSISLSYGTSGVIYKDKLKDLLIDSISDNRDGIMDIMDSEMIISDISSNVINSISTVGTYSLTFNFEDLANNNLQGVNMNLIII
jgi:hypothetical protein